MKKDYFSANCEILMIDKQDVILTSGLSIEDSNGGIVLNWDIDSLS